MSPLTLFLLFILVAALIALRDIYLADRRLERLEHIPPLDTPDPPWVSVIIPACNEEQEIETALTSVLSLDYPNLEIIVLNDRSTDATPQILDRMAAQYLRLRVIQINQLPPGWLGKSHALHLGAEQARGEFLLFTDADVRMAPDTLNRSIARMIEYELDHLCLLPSLVPFSSLLAMLLTDSFSGLLTLFRPWLVSRSDSRTFMGVGAFNLVRSSSYEGGGGHRPIRLCPMDDILLGRMVKENGGRSDCLNGCRLVSVPIYHSVREMTHGLRKNIFALIDYRLELLAAGTLLIIFCYILPFWGVFLLDGPARLLCVGIVAISCLVMVLATRLFDAPLISLLWFPVTPYIKLYIIWQATLFTLMRGGIDWRGTFYSLDELRAHKVSALPWVKMKKREGDLF